MMDYAAKADLLAASRKVAAIYVTEVAPGANDTPEKILFDANQQSPAEMLAAYQERRANYDTLPLDVEGDLVRLYPGQWSVFSGYTGTGKTTFLRQMVCHLLKAKRRVFVATLESDPADYLVELASTAAGVELVSETQLAVFLATYGAQIKIWGIIGESSHKKMLATIRDISNKEGLDYAVIDSLMMMDIPEDGIDEQRKFAALLTASAITTKTHIILVAHPKKPMDADAAPTVHNVSGSAKLTNLAFNVLFIRRGPQVVGGDKNVTQMLLYVLKQRTRGLVGEITGCFHRLRNQFSLDAMSQQPTFYLPATSYPASGLTEDVPAHIMNPDAFRVRDTEPPSGNVMWAVTEDELFAKKPWEI